MELKRNPHILNVVFSAPFNRTNMELKPGLYAKIGVVFELLIAPIWN